LALANLNNPTTIAHYDFAFVKPLDEKELHSIFKTFKTIITLEDGVTSGGFGSAVLEFAARNNYFAIKKYWEFRCIYRTWNN
jgi:1-deoxy-D-xylulose-5-phosphate synthase